MSVAQAAEPAVTWEGPAECSDARAALAVAAELTGQDPLVVPPDRRLRGVVAATGSGWQLELTLRDGGRERSRVLVAPSCPELMRAAGVALALALYPEEDARLDPGAPTPPLHADAPVGSAEPRAPGAEGAIEETAVEATVEMGTGARPVAIEWRIEADALLDTTALGSAAPGLAVSFGARLGALTGLVYGAWLPALQREVEGGGRVEFALRAGGLRSCYELARGLLAADACAGVELGRLAASGERLDNAASFSDWWLAPSFGVALHSALGGSLYLRASADAVVPVLREAYRVNAGALVHRAPSVGFRGGVALGVVLGGGG